VGDLDFVRGIAGGNLQLSERAGDTRLVRDNCPWLVLQKCNTIGRMAWIVELLDSRVRDELDALPADMRARFRRIVELIQAYGLEQMREPHVKHLEGSLWEMRMKGKDGISRAIYVTANGRRAVVVRVFVKKTQKTPRQEINWRCGAQRR
jgi:phage-related protein